MIDLDAYLAWMTIGAIGTWFTGIVMIITIYKTIYMPRAKRIALVLEFCSDETILRIYNDGNRRINIDDIKVIFYGEIISLENLIPNYLFFKKIIPTDKDIEIKIIKKEEFQKIFEKIWNEKLNNSHSMKYLGYRIFKFNNFKFKFIIQSDYDKFVSRIWIRPKNEHQVIELGYAKKDNLNYKKNIVSIFGMIIGIISGFIIISVIFDVAFSIKLITQYLIFGIITFSLIIIQFSILSKLGLINLRENLIFLIILLLFVFLILNVYHINKVYTILVSITVISSCISFLMWSNNKSYE